MYCKATQVLTACAVLVLAAAGVQAQQVYRIVGPDGRITYSDKPPADTSTRAAAAPTTASAGQPGGAAGQLPFALRQVAGRYPVTLYSSATCAPCTSARAFFNSRGIPFTERLVATNEDADALQRMSGDTTLPFITVGSQQIKGFSDVELGQFLDAAGYPKTSQLPPNFRNPPPAPLVAVQRPAAPEAAPAAAAPAPAAPPPAAAAPNPAGITF
ncbi:MAG: glutaredoxin family protein [Pseudomonadota bacterium]